MRTSIAPPATRRWPARRRGPASLSGTGPLRRVGVGLMWLIVLANVAGLGWMALQAFRDTRSILATPWGLPKGFSVENFVEAWTVSDFATATWNSTWVTLVSSVLTVAVAAPAAYWLSRQESRLSRGLTLFFVLGLGVPVQVILIPLFVMLNSVRLIDSLVGLNLVYIGLSMPFTVFLLTGFFRSLPAELEEAAALDGASPAGVFWRVMLPMAKGGMLTAFVLQLIGHWNETLLAVTLLHSTENYTLPVALISFVQQQTYSGADWGGLFAGLCIIVLPMLAVYVWLGRRLTEGLTLGMGK
ncbi:carbohydrate ABC transporter permease [Micromonospora sp. MP36]|nr:carbohydrate ABC transporter permease [Micromonospora sp. MP36]